MPAAAWAVIAGSALLSTLAAIWIVTAWQRVSDLLREYEDEK